MISRVISEIAIAIVDRRIYLTVYLLFILLYAYNFKYYYYKLLLLKLKY